MSPVPTLVERSTRFLMLVALSNGDHKADTVADALTVAVKDLPIHLTRSLTWDLGHEMAAHQRSTIDIGIQVYLCDPRPPGGAAATRTPTACCVSTCPDEWTSAP
jgi:IS30 family transposase